jgi:CRP-like cAMP-binding protein/SAM-dependent methyltransferase
MFEGLEILTAFDESDSDWLERVGQDQQANAGTTIIQEGSNPSAIYFVQEGLLGVTVSSAGNKQLAVLGPGELVGEISFLGATPATATVTAVESTLLLAVSRQDLEDKLDSDPAFAAHFYKTLALISSRRLRQRVNSLGAELRAKQRELGERAAAAERETRIERMVLEFQQKLEKADKQAILKGHIPPALAEEIKRDFQTMTKRIDQEIGRSSSLDDHVKEEIGARLKTELFPYLLLTKTTERFYSKPRGYAGDFLTIDRIYENQAAGSGRLGKLLDECFLAASPAAAVRNRRDLLAEEIRRTIEQLRGSEVRITSLACGPAREVFDVFDTIDENHRLSVTLLDIDAEALAFVAKRAKQHGCDHRVNRVRANLVYLALGRHKLDLPPQHLVYSIGLIDYFNDRLVGRLIDYIYSLLEPGGRVILGNFHPNNRDKAFMDHILEWQLIHRNEEDMNRLFAASRFGRGCTRIRFEQQGINLFAECVRK